MAIVRRPRDLCTLDEVKRFLPNYTEPTDANERTAADRLIADLISSATDRIYEVSGREFLSYLDPGDTTDAGGTIWPLAPLETRIYDLDVNRNTPGGGTARQLIVGDMQVLTAVGISWRWATSDIVPYSLALDPYVRAYPSPRPPGYPIRRLELIGGTRDGDRIHVTGRWGWPTVPDSIRMACAEQAAVWTGRDLARFSQTFLEVAAAGGTANEPRSLSQSVYDTAYLYRIPSLG